MSELVKNIQVSVPVNRTTRVLQAESIFDFPPSKRSSVEWKVKLDLPEEWNIGVIVGPSGSGKTTVAREIFGDNLVGEYEWSADRSILDDFPKEMGIKEIIALLSSVGFSSPPSWVRPYRVLSTGEKFRVTIARAIAEMQDMAVIDEFTSVVDRTVAKIGSAAVAKTVRKLDKKLIAVSCHYDIVDWLEPDWVYQPHTNEFYCGRYLHQRPTIKLTVRKVHHSAWEIFRRFHYLDTSLNKASHCFVAFAEDGSPVAFYGIMSFPHPSVPGWRFHRLVCLPDYQGIGIGMKFSDYMASIFAATGKPVYSVASHPAVIHYRNKSPLWSMYRKPKRSPLKGKTSTMDTWNVANRRLVAGFKYVGPLADEETVRMLFGGKYGYQKNKT